MTDSILSALYFHNEDGGHVHPDRNLEGETFIGHDFTKKPKGEKKGSGCSHSQWD